MKLAAIAVVVACCVGSSFGRVIAGEELSPTYEKHRILEDLSVGKWAIRGTTDGRAVEGVLEGKWAPGKYCVTLSGYVQPVGSTEKTHLSGITGWDIETGKIKEQLYMSDGASATALFEVRDRTLIGKRHGVNADGTKFSQDLRFSVGENRWVGLPVEEVDSNGKVLKKHGEWIFTCIETE